MHESIKLVILRLRFFFSRSRKDTGNQHVLSDVKDFKINKRKIIRRSSFYIILKILKRRLVFLVLILIIYCIMLVIYLFFTIRLSVLIPIPASRFISIILFISIWMWVPFAFFLFPILSGLRFCDCLRTDNKRHRAPLL